MKLNRDYNDYLIHRQVVKSWNGAYASGELHGQKRVLGPFRAVTSRGDYLGRQSDNTSLATLIPPGSSNSKNVPNCSDYIHYKKQRSMNLGYSSK
jgi:hypothetical protein